MADYISGGGIHRAVFARPLDNLNCLTVRFGKGIDHGLSTDMFSLMFVLLVQAVIIT